MWNGLTDDATFQIRLFLRYPLTTSCSSHGRCLQAQPLAAGLRELYGVCADIELDPVREAIEAQVIQARKAMPAKDTVDCGARASDLRCQPVGAELQPLASAQDLLNHICRQSMRTSQRARRTILQASLALSTVSPQPFVCSGPGYPQRFRRLRRRPPQVLDTLHKKQPSKMSQLRSTMSHRALLSAWDWVVTPYSAGRLLSVNNLGGNYSWPPD